MGIDFSDLVDDSAANPSSSRLDFSDLVDDQASKPSAAETARAGYEARRRRRGGLINEMRPYVAGEGDNPVPKPAVKPDTALDRPAGFVETPEAREGRLNWESLSPQGQTKATEEAMRARRASPIATTRPDDGLTQKASRAVKQALGTKTIAGELGGAATDFAGDMLMAAGVKLPTSAAGLVFKSADMVASLAGLGSVAPDQFGESLFSRAAGLAGEIGKAAGRNQSTALQAQRANIEQASGVIASIEALLGNPYGVADMAVESAGSMKLANAVAQGAGRVATAAAFSRGIRGEEALAKIYSAAAERGSHLANIGMNSADTFSDTDGTVGDKALAALGAAAGTHVAGKVFHGGAEGARAAGRVDGALRTGFNEFGQETTEALSQKLGQAVGEGRPMDLNKDIGDALKEGAAGAMSGAVSGATQAPARVPQTADAAAEAQGFKVSEPTLGRSLLDRMGVTPVTPPQPRTAVAGAVAELGGAAPQRTGSGLFDDLLERETPPTTLGNAASEVLGAARAAGDGMQVSELAQAARAALRGDAPAPTLESLLSTPAAPAPTAAMPTEAARGVAWVDDAGAQKVDTGPKPPLGEFPKGDNFTDATGAVWGKAEPEPTLQSGWKLFGKQSGTLGIPRAEMPQIKGEHRGAMVNFLNARDVAHERVEVDPNSLKPSQAEYSPEKVDKAGGTSGDRSILISSDGHVLDGHHQWMAAKKAGTPVSAIRLDGKAEDVLPLMHEFPSSTVDTASAPATMPSNEAAQPASAATPQPAPAAASMPAGPAGVVGSAVSRGYRRLVQDRLSSWAKRNNVPAEEVPQVGEPDAEAEATVSAIDSAIGGLLGEGHRVIAYSDPRARVPNGFAQGGVALVNVARNEQGVAHTALHEIKHVVEQIANADAAAGRTGTAAQKFVAKIDGLFDDMSEQGKRAYVENYLLKQELAGLAREQREARIREALTSDQLRSEMTADFLGNRGDDRAFMKGLAKADPEGFKAFVEKWLAVLDGMLDRLRGAPRRNATEARKVDTYMRDLSRAKEVAQQALIEYRKGSAAEASAEVSNDEQFKAEADSLALEDVPFSRSDDEARQTIDENGNPEFANGKVRVAFPIETERLEVIPGPGEKVLSYAIMPTTGFDVLGHVELLVKDGKPVSLLDIAVNPEGRKAGVGRAAVEAVLAGTEGDLNISNIVTEARGFWGKLGVPEQNLPDGHAYDGVLNAATYSKRAGPDAPAVRNQAGRAAQPANEPDAGARQGTDARAEGGGRAALEQDQREVASQATAAFEVAPDPNDEALAERWRALPAETRLAVSQHVAEQIVPKVLAQFGARGDVTGQVGSYLEDTNPSFALKLDSAASALEVTKALGHVLAQDSMVLLAAKPFPGGSETGAIDIHIGRRPQAEVERIYNQLRAIRVGDEQPIGGQSTVDGVMTVLNFSNVETMELAHLIDEALGGSYNIDVHQVYAAFPEKQDYGYAGQESDTRADSQALRRWAGALRSEATGILGRELDAAERYASRVETRRQADEVKPAQPAPNPPSQADAGPRTPAQVLRGEALAAVKRGDVQARTGERASDAAYRWLQERAPMAVDRPDLGRVEVRASGIESSLRHGFGWKKLNATAALREVIERGVVIGQSPDASGKPLLHTYLAAPVTLEGERHFLVVRLRQDTRDHQPHLFYQHEVVPESSAAPLIKTGTEPAEQAGNTGEGSRISTLLQRALSGNDEGPKFSKPQGATWDSPGETKLADAIFQLQDRQVDLKHVARAIRESGSTLTDRTDGYLREELYHGRVAARTHQFAKKELQPLFTAMRAAGVTLPELEEYLHARHAPERNAEMKARNPGVPNNDALSGMSDADAAAIMAKAKPVMKTLAGRVDAIIDGTRNLMEMSGLEDAVKMAGVRAKYANYVPLHRDEVDPGRTMPAKGQGFSVKGSNLKRATGSDAKVTNILAHIVMEREATITRSEKNLVATAIYAMAVQNPNTDFWQVDKPPKIKKVDDRREILDPVSGQMVPNPDYNTVYSVVDPAYKSRDEVLIAKINGEDRAVIFNVRDPRAMRMVRALKNLDLEPMNMALNVIGKATRWFAAVNTQYNPVFMVVNGVRDVQGALLNLDSTPLKGQQKRVLGNAYAALRGIWRAERDPTARGVWEDRWREYQLRGGQTGWRESFEGAQDRAKALQKEIKALDRKIPSRVIHGVLDLLGTANESVENAIRLSAYSAARGMGISQDKAASIGKNLTVNFNRKGQAGQKLGALYAFFNAAMQGHARLAQALMGPTGKMIIGGGLLLGVLQALMMAGMDDDDKEAIPDFVLEKSLVIPLPGHKFIQIPLHQGFNVLPTIGRHMTEMAIAAGTGQRLEFGKHTIGAVSALAGAFNPIGGGGSVAEMITPTPVDPIIQIVTNKDFTGRPIYTERPMNDPARPGAELKRQSTNAAWGLAASAVNRMTGGDAYSRNTDLGEWASPQPEILRHIAESVGGGVWRETERIVDAVLAGLDPKGEADPARLPFVTRFYGDLANDHAPTSQFMQNLAELSALKRQIEGMGKDGNGEGIDRLLKKRPEAALVDAADDMRSQIKQLRETRRELAVADASTDQLKEIEHQQAELMRAFNKMVREAKVAVPSK
jgi:ribosomal protein S18 acetylase RimI-like enzyme